MSEDLFTRSRLLGALVVVATALAALLIATPASADTTFPPSSGPFTLSVTTGGTTYAYPNGGSGPTLPNLTDGQSLTIKVDGTSSGANFSRLRARQCKAGVAINNGTAFDPYTFNRCSQSTLGAGSPDAFVDSGPIAPGVTTSTITFKVGAGAAPALAEGAIDGLPYPGFTCGTGGACVVVVDAEVTTGGGSSNYLSYPLSFFVAPPTDNVLMECNQVALTGAVKAPLNNTMQPNVAFSLKSTTTVGQYPRTCTGSSAAAAGPLTKVSGKLVGPASCAAGTAPVGVAAPNGKVTFTWSSLDVKGKPVTSATYLRFDRSTSLVDEVGVENGLVTKGVGIGADVEGSFLLQPTLKKGGPADLSTLAANGSIVAGSGSLQLATGCTTGVNTISEFVASTDGSSLTGAPFDSSVRFVLPS